MVFLIFNIIILVGNAIMYLLSIHHILDEVNKIFGPGLSQNIISPVVCGVVCQYHSLQHFIYSLKTSLSTSVGCVVIRCIIIKIYRFVSRISIKHLHNLLCFAFSSLSYDKKLKLEMA